MSSPTTSKDYHGDCHCGAVKYTVTLSPPLEEQQTISCNCSICLRNGYLFVYPLRENVTFESGEDTLKAYTFGKHRIEHKFCPTCGTSILGKSLDPTFLIDRYAINVRTFHDVDLDNLNLKKINNKD